MSSVSSKKDTKFFISPLLQDQRTEKILTLDKGTLPAGTIDRMNQLTNQNFSPNGSLALTTKASTQISGERVASAQTKYGSNMETISQILTEEIGSELAPLCNKAVITLQLKGVGVNPISIGLNVDFQTSQGRIVLDPKLRQQLQKYLDENQITDLRASIYFKTDERGKDNEPCLRVLIKKYSLEAPSKESPLFPCSKNGSVLFPTILEIRPLGNHSYSTRSFASSSCKLVSFEEFKTLFNRNLYPNFLAAADHPEEILDFLKD